MGSHARHPRHGRQSPTRSIRIDDDLWEKVKRRAESEGVTVSRALYLLTEAYAKGIYDLPQVKIVYGRAHQGLAEQVEKFPIESEPAQPDETTGYQQETTVTSDGAIFDPETDPPEVRPDPKGTRTQKDWCGLLLFGQLRAINQRKNRGATKAEQREIARAAGYRDGRAWAGWSPRAWEDDETGGRWTNERGVEFLRHYYTEVDRGLPDDLT